MVAATVEHIRRGSYPALENDDPRLLSVGRGIPPHYYSQSELIDAFTTVWDGNVDIKRRMSRLHNAVKVTGRHLALSIPEYLELNTFGQANDAFIRVGTEWPRQPCRMPWVESDWNRVTLMQSFSRRSQD